MYGIKNKENFKLEVVVLLMRIRKHIDAVTTYYQAYLNRPNKKIATQIAILKIHEYRMKEAKEWLEKMSDKEWLENKKYLQEEFKEANQLLVTT